MFSRTASVGKKSQGSTTDAADTATDENTVMPPGYDQADKAVTHVGDAVSHPDFGP